MSKTLTIDWSPNDVLVGEAVLQGWRSGDPVQLAHTYADSFRGLAQLIAGAERLDLLAKGLLDPSAAIQDVMSAQLGGNRAEYAAKLMTFSTGGAAPLASAAGQSYLAAAYLASLHTARELYYGARRVTDVPPVLALSPVQPAVAPLVVVALAAVGIAAVAGATWYGVDRNEKSAQVQNYAAQAAAQVDLYIRDLQARIAAGKPLPSPPSPIIRAASVEANSKIAMLGTGALAGAIAVAGAMLGKKPAPARAANPNHRRAPSRRRRRRRSNPLRGGYSRATVSANIAQLQREGRPAPQASAIALRSARDAYKAKHGSKALPAHLKPASATKPKPKPSSRPKPKRSKAAAPKRRANESKAAPKRKNPRSSKDAFIRGQMHKGRSAKQAAADWKARARLRKMRKKKGKARARRR